MIRIICREDSAPPPHHALAVSYRSFIVEAPAVEAWLREPQKMGDFYTSRHVIGVEVVPDEKGGQ